MKTTSAFIFISCSETTSLSASAVAAYAALVPAATIIADAAVVGRAAVDDARR